MGFYITYEDILAAADANTIERSTDELQPGTSNQDYVNNLILKREIWFESYATIQEDRTTLRANKSEEAKRWITAAVINDLYGRRTVPAQFKEKYLEAREELINYSRTGVPRLVDTSTAVVEGSRIDSNMTEADLDEMPWNVDAIVSVWKGMP